jgi:Dolichyl-phosphate-mannose-protein mannosyltransferase
MDDVDSVQAQIARNMLESGDWVTARLDGVKYLEKAPLWYWLIGLSFRIFGVHDWAARIPVFLSAVLLCLLTYWITKWSGSKEASFYAGLALATSVGLFLFTRILIPDVALTLCIALSLWAFLRSIDPAELRARAWAWAYAAGIGIGMLLKGLIAAVFLIGIAAVYLLITGQWRKRDVWRRLHIWSGLLIAVAIAAPWHIIATLRNPPYFVATLHSGPGEYKGFFWFYFVNEQVLRFLNLRYPRDYNTVPWLWFWLLHFAWFFPWSFFLPSVLRLRHGVENRASRLRLLAVIWIGVVLVFFTFSTTQEYYSMPCYPAFAMLIGMSIANPEAAHKWSLRVVAMLSGLCFAATIGLLIASWNLPTPGDIARALVQHPSAYTLSLGHMGDLTIASFAYLRLPLALAALAFAVGLAGLGMLTGRRAYLSLAVMMILLLHAARLALVRFDPYLSSRPLAQALLASPAGHVIFDDQYYTFSSVSFYTGKRVLLLNGRVNNLEYGSNAPDAPQVFISDSDLRHLWRGSERYYLLAEAPAVQRFVGILGTNHLHVIAESGGKYLFTNLQ